MSASQQALLGAGGAAGLPVDANVILLLRMEGANGGTTFFDSSALVNTLAASSGPTTSTDRAKSGTASCKCVGTGYLSLTGTAGTELPGDFTAECWAYWTQTPAGTSAPFGLTSSTTNLRPVSWTDNKLYLQDPGDKISGTTVITLNAWHHIAVTRTGSTIRMWLDGVQQGGTYTSSLTYCANGLFSYIGSADATTALLGYSTTPAYLDLVRISNVDRYGTASFTPPADY
jgi:hypothetical protein